MDKQIFENIIIYYIILVAFLFFFETGASLGARYLPGVFGKDNRQIIRSNSAPYNAIGQVNYTSYRIRSQCTGTLIAHNLVLTAKHCITNQRTGKQYPVRQIHFVAGVKPGKHLDSSIAKCILTLPKNSSKPDIAVPDIAIIVLRKKMHIAPVKLWTENIKTGRLLIHASYPRERRHLLSAHKNCKLQGKKGPVWFTDCDTNFGSSGGPVFVKENNRQYLAAVMFGIIKNRASLAISVTTINSLLKKTTCK